MSGTLHAGLGLGVDPAVPVAAPRPSRISLRDKGRLALVLLVTFFGLLTGLGWYHMSGMRQDATAMEAAGSVESRLHELARTARAAEVDAALAQSSQLYAAGAQRLAVHFDRLRDTGSLGISGVPPWQRSLQVAAAAFERFQLEPAPQSLDSLRATLTTLGQVLDGEERAAEQRTATIGRALQERAHSGARVMLAMAVAGSALFGLALMLFMRHLAGDLDLLRQRALQILAGVSGDTNAAPPPISPAPQPLALAAFVGQPPSARHDEVGHLAVSIEQLAGHLATQKRELEIERRNVFNQEKQAALGALAAGVLDEIGNPIAAVDGYARALHEIAAEQATVTTSPGALDPLDAEVSRALAQALNTQVEFAAAIVREVERLHAITHDMAVLAAPQPHERQLVSLNELVDNALGLLRFDPRLRDVRVESRLDPNLPALRGRADQLVQLVMNLVVNAADAVHARAGAQGGTDGRVERCHGHVQVTTLINGKNATLLIADNGPGMDEEVRRRAFDPLFTTKPAGQGTGLGLPLCKAIAAGHGGHLHLDSTPGRGTTVTVVLPLEVGA